MAERQEKHRQDLERRTIIGDGRRAWAGIVCAFLICIGALAVALVIALHRQDLGGNILSGLIGAGGLIGLAGVFIYGTKVRREERAEKARLLAGRD